MNEHLKALLREWIGQTFNRHERGPAPSMVLFASRRSGTTLLAQAFEQLPDVKPVDQPLSVFTGSLTQLRRLPLFRGGYAISPEGQEARKLRRYFEDIEEGRLHVREPWRIGRAFRRHTRRVFYKCTDAHAVTNIVLDATEAIPLAMYRHPISQAQSCIRRGWQPRLSAYLDSRSYVRNYLSSPQLSLAEEVMKSGTLMERYVLDWLLENRPLLERSEAGEIAFATYEWLVSAPTTALPAICAHYGAPFKRRMLDVFDRPSRSSGARTGSTVGDIVHSGAIDQHLRRWKETLSMEEADAVQRLFAEFDFELYTAHSAMPARRSRLDSELRDDVPTAGLRYQDSG